VRPRPRLERLDHLRARRVGHRVLAPDRKLGITGLVRVVRENDDPTRAAGVREQALQRAKDLLRTRVCKRPVDEVLQHVDHDQRTHYDLPSAQADCAASRIVHHRRWPWRTSRRTTESEIEHRRHPRSGAPNRKSAPSAAGEAALRRAPRAGRRARR
jgi:hypothetical protein